ncbi:hypothetical protein MNBD_UNCLBAC01-2168 [hydrothermal vent metagenome]|uniref:Uncharacterized protein n=1 Tax=hydrothermal vent metagenome TaxID=652676 RepID=A0A3B1DP08_9ZZZZ
MINYIEKKRTKLTYRIISLFVAFTFIFSSILPPTAIHAQIVPQTILNLPISGTMITSTAGYTPTIIRGLTIHPDNALAFDFIVDKGDESLEGKIFNEKARDLIKYFLAGLTVPKDEMWVNLSPYEQDRIIPNGFGDTKMGRDMLAQDYMLKQLTASLMYPENELGKKFWDRVYTKAEEQFGTTEIPVNTFNKIWIVPEKAVVYEKDSSVFVVESHLKVMLEEDYVAMNENIGNAKFGLDNVGNADMRSVQDSVSEMTKNIISEILIPEIEKEVNEGKIFANLRQIFNSIILAEWYKENLKESLLGQVYVDQHKTKGVDTEDKDINQKIYNQYVEAFEKGVYNYIKEDYDPATQEIIPRKYFSGGTTASPLRVISLPKNQPLPAQYQHDFIFDGNNVRVTGHHIEVEEDQNPEEVLSLITDVTGVRLGQVTEPSIVAAGEKKVAASPIKKVLLLAPEVPGVEPQTYRMSLGIPYIAAELRHQYEAAGKKVDIQILDIHLEKENNPDFNIDKFFEENFFDVVGISMVTAAFNNAGILAKKIKEKSPKTVLVTGGPHPTSRGREVLENLEFDIAAIGEAEKTFAEIVALSDKPEEWDSIKGIHFRSSDGNIEKTEDRPAMTNQELDELPFPAWNFVNDKYTTYDYGMNVQSYRTVLTARGCPFKCYFCDTSFGKKMRYRSIKNVVDEIEQAVAEGITNFYIQDDTFTVHMGRVEEFVDLIIKRKLKINWWALSRSDIGKTDRGKALLKKMKESGLDSLALGVESHDQVVLDAMDKGTKMEDVEETIRVMQDLGITVRIFIMVGLPKQDKKSIDGTIDFIRRMKPDVVTVNILTPYPGTPVAKNPKKYGTKILIEDGPEGYEQLQHAMEQMRVVIQTEDLSPEDILNEAERVREAFEELKSARGKLSAFLLENHRALAIDLDGTLTDEDGDIPMEAIEFLAKPLMQGIPVAIMTGRRQEGFDSAQIPERLEAFLEQHGDTSAMELLYVYLNGGAIGYRQRDHKKLFYERNLSENAREDAFKIINDIFDQGTLQEGSFITDQYSIYIFNDYKIRIRLRKSENAKEINAQLNTAFQKNNINLTAYVGEDPSSGHMDINIFPKDTNKAASLDDFANRIGISDDEIVRIGDEGLEEGIDFSILNHPLGVSVHRWGPSFKGVPLPLASYPNEGLKATMSLLGQLNWKKIKGKASSSLNKSLKAPKALSGVNEEGYGGINFNTDLINWQIKRDGNGVPLPMNSQPMNSMQIDGFVPVIINVTPVSLPLLLGLNNTVCPDDGSGNTNCADSVMPVIKPDGEAVLLGTS